MIDGLIGVEVPDPYRGTIFNNDALPVGTEGNLFEIAVERLGHRWTVGLAGVYIPQPHPVGTDGGYSVAVRTKSHIRNPLGRAGQWLAGVEIPYPKGVIDAEGGEELSVWAKCRPEDTG